MTLDRAGKTRTGTVELRMFSSVGHLGAVPWYTEALWEPWEADPHFPDKESETLYDLQKLTHVENSVQCGNGQTLGARFKFYSFSYQDSTEGTLQRGLVVREGTNAQTKSCPCFKQTWYMHLHKVCEITSFCQLILSFPKIIMFVKELTKEFPFTTATKWSWLPHLPLMCNLKVTWYFCNSCPSHLSWPSYEVFSWTTNLYNEKPEWNLRK